MRRSLARFSRSDASCRTPWWAGCITNTSGFRISARQVEQPGHQPRRQRRLPRSHPTYRAEASRQKVPIDLPRQPHQRMAKVDDLLERRAKPVVLAIVMRLAHRSPPTANLAVEGITDRPNQESQTAIKPARPAFLQNRLLAQVKSSRSDQSLPHSSRTTKWPTRTH